MNNKWLSKKFVIAEAIFLVLAVVGLNYTGYFSEVGRELNGNDKESIINTIHSIEGYQERPVNILEIKDFGDERIVGFLYGTSPAYINFEKNEDEDYKWYYASIDRRGDFEQFIPNLPRGEHPKLLFVTNGQNRIAKMEVKINGKKIQQEFNTNEPSVKWVDFPEKNQNRYTFRDYKHYDENGELIEAD